MRFHNSKQIKVKCCEQNQVDKERNRNIAPKIPRDRLRQLYFTDPYHFIDNLRSEHSVTLYITKKTQNAYTRTNTKTNRKTDRKHIDISLKIITIDK